MTNFIEGGNVMSWSKIRMFVYGFLLGTAGVKVLGSSDAKKGLC